MQDSQQDMQYLQNDGVIISIMGTTKLVHTLMMMYNVEMIDE